MPVITLTTEWRSDDIYSGIIKGKLCSLCPEAPIIDNAYGIPPFDLAHASFIVRNTFLNYPKGSVHIICIHSEARKGEGYLVIRARDHFFVGTDNGIFSLILNSEPDEVYRISHDENEDELDIFARTAADLFRGIMPAIPGQKAGSINEKVPLRATIDSGVIIGSVIFIDSYGNAITNITREVFSRVFDKREFRIFIQSNKNYTGTISGAYSDVPVGELLARFNSLDLLEIAINGADVSELLSLSPGSSVRVDLVNRSVPPNRLF